MIDALNRALDELEDALVHRREVDVAMLARTAMTSTTHLRRLFSAMAGMPLSTYVRRRRMTLAAAEVLAGGQPLLQIALDHGYGSTEAFGRAFRDVHGVTPREARGGAADLVTQPRLRFRLTIEGAHPMLHRIIDKPAFTIAGKHVRVPLQYEGANPHIAAFVAALPQETLTRIEALSDQDPAGIVAATHVRDPDRAEGSDVDYYHAAITSGPVPDDLDAVAVPAGTWAVFSVDGPFPAALQQMWADTAAVWFPANPYRTVDGPELLRVDQADDGATARCELWIPVEHDPASAG